MLGKTNSLFLLAYFSCPEFLGESYAPVQPSVPLCNLLGWQSPHRLVTTHEKMKERKEQSTHAEWVAEAARTIRKPFVSRFTPFSCESAEFLAPRLSVKGSCTSKAFQDSCLHVQSRVSPFCPQAPAPLGHSHQAWLWSSPSILGPLPIQCGCAWPWWPLRPEPDMVHFAY